MIVSIDTAKNILYIIPMSSEPVWDVIIIGAGPGGALSACRLAEAGKEVLVLEKEAFPRHKPCGGALSKKAENYLPMALFPYDRGKVRGARFTFRGKDAFVIRSDEPVVTMVSRPEFDEALINEGAKRGAEVRFKEKVTGIEEGNDSVIVRTLTGKMFQATYLIGADGPRGISARLLNPAYTAPMGIALEEEVTPAKKISSELDVVSLDFGRFPWGYGWVFPKKGLFSIGGGVIVRQNKVLIKKNYKEFKNNVSFLTSQREASVPGAHLLPYFIDARYRRATRRILLVGDAARLMDPFLGEGIAYAMASGEMAAQAILETGMKRTSAERIYCTLLEKNLLNELKSALKLAQLVYPRIENGFKTLKRFNGLGYLYLDVMAGKLSYQNFYKALLEKMKDAGKRKLNTWINKAAFQKNLIPPKVFWFSSDK